MKDSALRSALFILFICCCAYILSMFNRVCPAVISLDLCRDLSLDNSQISLLSGLTLLSYGAMQLPSGLLADWLGGRRSLVILLVLTGAATIWFSMTSSFSGVVASRFLTGIGLSITVPCMVVLAGKFSSGSFGRASSAFLCCGGLGNILAAGPLAASSSLWGWRTSILAAGIVTLLLAACVWVFVHEDIRPAPAKNPGTPRQSVLGGIVQILHMRHFWPIALWGMSIMGIYFAMFSLWWGPYLMTGCSLSKADASLVMTAGAIMAMASQPIAGWLSDSVCRSRKMPVVIATAAGVATATVMVSFQGFNQWQAAALIVFFVLGTATTSSLLYAMLRESIPLHLMGSASGLMGMLPPIWGVLMQKLYGFLLDFSSSDPATAFRMASFVVLANCIIGFAASLFMKETFGQTPSAR